MSQVFRALDRNLGREVALKILHQSLSQDEVLAAMFEREAKLTASILHPNVVKVFSVGQDQGYFYIAMELLQAISLEQLCAKKGALSESEALRIALDVARGLQAAQEENLIHRDIKPGNMLVTEEGTTKLVDFGLALQQGGEELSEDLWATPFYVPPEKLDGQADTFLGDIYSLGATLYHALAGKPPFEANTSSMEELKVIKENAVDLKSAAPGLSRATIKLVEKMMAYRPEDRIQSYAELIAQIEEVRHRQFGIRSDGRGASKKTRIGLGIAGGAGLVATALALIVYLMHSRAPVVEGKLGIGQGDRVITAEENTITGQFLAARALFVEGRFPEATDAFSSLVANGAALPSTRIWSLFFLGATRLFNGEPQLAAESFREVLSITPEADVGGDEAYGILKRAAALAVDPLPVRPDEAGFSASGVESLGLLVAGLKNWQEGEFRSAATLLQAFHEAQAPESYVWIGGLRRLVEPFLSDYALIQSLPNPSAIASDLDAQAVALGKGAESLKTSGAAPRFVKLRIDRIAAIRKLAAVVPPPEPAPAMPAPTPASAANPATPSVPPGTPSPEELAEMERIKALLVSFRPLSETLLFASAVQKLQGETFATPGANQIREELIYAYNRAAQFPARFAEGLVTSPFEGTVRRRAGRDLEAKVTPGDAESFIVDLGFGPNEVGIGEFSLEWLIETGIGLLPPVSAETSGAWETLVYFGLCTGQNTLVVPKAEALAAVEPSFAKRWQILQQLR